MATSRSLTDDEIQTFWDELDHDSNGQITFSELERRLEMVHDELVPNPKKHNLNHPSRNQPKQVTDKSGEKHTHSSDLHDFLCKLMPGCGEAMDKDEFVRRVKSWDIPSPQGNKTEKDDAQEYEKKLPFRRRAKAWWSVKGPEVAFLTFVVALQLGFGLWQFLYYLLDRDVARAALGWGVVCAKLAAGVLYPTTFFMVLSMSRWFATFCRKSYTISRFINWDYSQNFHIIMACETVFFALLHTIGHLTGSFVWGSRGSNQDNVAALLGPAAVPMSYAAFIRERPGWTGLTALSCFLLIGITSAPWFRKKSYELFQWFHLLMYPAFAMLAMHGTARILQFPMMGFWLIIPVILVLVERSTRGYLSFFGHHNARLEALDDGTVVITAEKPDGKVWHAKAGQYVFIQVPQISRFQWHPFTISACIRNRLQVHIKADGNWTEQLHALATKAKKTPGQSGDDDLDFVRIKVGVDGPFGAPAQRFYTYDKAIIVGAGIGVTPFSAILTDLEENFRSKGDPWQLTRTRSFIGRKAKRTLSRRSSASSLTPVNTQTHLNPTSDGQSGSVSPANAAGEGLSAGSTAAGQGGKATGQQETKEERKARLSVQGMRKSRPGSYGVRRVDFHWSVRERNDLLWFSDLLNRASALAAADMGQHLTLNVHAHVTAKKKSISTHVFRYLLDSYRTKEHPESALTGLRAGSHFGRPDFPAILDEFYKDMKNQGWHGRVGVFFCGPPVIGEVLADCCGELTARAKHEGYGMRFIMQIEVFN